MFQVLRSFWADEEAAAAIEFSLIAALIALAIVLGAGVMGNEINSILDRIGQYLKGLQVGPWKS